LSERTGSRGLLTKWLMRLAPAVFFIIFLVAAELTIRATYWGLAPGEDLAGWDPTGLSVYECEKTAGEVSICRTGNFFKYNMAEQEFRMPKPESTRRIFVVGGSAAAGFPFLNYAAFSKLLETGLSAADPYTTYEVINSGSLGAASFQVKVTFREVLQYDPDLIIIEMGNNEFLGRDPELEKSALSDVRHCARNIFNRSYLVKAITRQASLLKPVTLEAGNNIETPGDLAQRVAQFKKTASSKDWDDASRDAVLKSYRENLTGMIELAKERDLKVIVSTLADNVRDYPPFSASEEYALLSRCGELAFGTTEQMCAKSAEEFQDEAVEVYVRGCCKLVSGDPEKGASLLLRAVELDPLPVRPPSRINEIILDTADKEGVPLCDLHRLFESYNPDSPPGDDLFLTHVHPTLRGQGLVAMAIMSEMEKAGMFPARPGWEEDAGRAISNYFAMLPDGYLFRSYYRATSSTAVVGRFYRAREMGRMAMMHLPEGEPEPPLIKIIDQVIADLEEEKGLRQ